MITDKAIVGLVSTAVTIWYLAEWLTNHESMSVGWWDWQGARNYLFVDGHAKYVQAEQIQAAGNDYPDINLTIGGIGGTDY